MATVFAEIVIADVITLTGYLQFAAAGSGVSTYLKVTGAVGTEIDFLGSLAGTLKFQ